MSQIKACSCDLKDMNIELHDELAGILEYESGMKREEAEKKALQMMNEMSKLNHICSKCLPSVMSK